VNNTLLNDPWVIDEIKEETKRFLEVKMKTEPGDSKMVARGRKQKACLLK
jgi:hypothetical protein